MLLMTGAGPIVNAVVAFGCWVLMNNHEARPEHSLVTVNFAPLVLNFFLANCYLLVTSLISFYHLDSDSSANDGRLMWRLLFPPLAASQSAALQASVEVSHVKTGATPETPPVPEDPSLAWKKTVATFPIARFLALCRHNIHSSTKPDMEKLTAMDGFATAVLMYGASGYLAEANKYSLKLANAKPDDWSALGTRGSVLIEMGDLNEGMALLLPVYQNGRNAFDRGLAAAFMALACIKSDNLAQAANWLASARQADPNCVPAERIEALIGARSAATASQ